MDTSETYIKMCEKATEIQKLSPCRFNYGSNMSLWNSGDKVILSEHKKGTFVCDSLYNLFVEGWWAGKTQHIWLPRQDQLQEMIGCLEKGFIDWFSWLGNTYGFNYGNKPNGHLHIFTTYEQLWLAFVMKQRYNKTWNGEEWVT